jgi:hypothetical protein
MSDKKPYSLPQLFQVELNHEQAILSVCTSARISLQAGNGTFCRNVNGCKKGTTMSGFDSNSPPS